MKVSENEINVKMIMIVMQRASEKPQPVKMLVAKPKDLTMVDKVEGGNQLP